MPLLLLLLLLLLRLIFFAAAALRDGFAIILSISCIASSFFFCTFV
jgi:hypothetical protein